MNIIMPKDQNPDIRISVAMATYNGEKYLSEQLESILRCLDANDEIVISDDGSSDNTISIIEQYAERDKRIKLFDGPHAGVVKNFGNALANCRGSYIFLSDQDDVWHKDKVEVVLPQLTENILVCHNADIFNSITGEYEGDIQSKIGKKTSVSKNIIKNSFIGCCMAFRRELSEYATPFPDERSIHIHDWWLGLIALKVGNVRFEEKSLIDYRIHESNTLGLKKTTFGFKIKKRINMIRALRRYFGARNKKSSEPNS